MNLTKFFYFLGDLFTWIFKAMEPIMGFVNIIFMVIIACLGFYWLLVLMKDQKGKSSKGLYPYVEDRKQI